MDLTAVPPSVNAGFYRYDALGRLCKRSAPWPTSPSLSRVETYYHDGVRRIQEVFADPVHAETPWADPYGTPPPAQTTQTRMEREYIWAAHETAGVNELHVAIDWFDREAWPIQDAHNQTVMGYADAAGELVEQRVYTPFGQVLSADKTALANPGRLYNDFRLRLGHNGLFADRLDADTTQPVLRHSGARVVHLTNNRVYEPLRGNWLQRDSNATGLVVLDGLVSQGQVFQPGVGAFDARSHYADDFNISVALGGNAAEHIDPTGLFLIDVIGAPTTALDVYADYNQEVANAGLGMVDYIQQHLSGVGEDQLYAMDAVLDWDTPDDLITFTAGGALVALGKRAGQGHHIIPKLMRGVNRAANILRLPRSDHGRYHKILREEFKANGLNAPNSRGDKRWVKRFKSGAVPVEERNRLRQALMSAARRFDGKTGGKFRVAERTRNGLRARHYLDGALDVGRALRRRGQR